MAAPPTRARVCETQISWEDVPIGTASMRAHDIQLSSILGAAYGAHIPVRQDLGNFAGYICRESRDCASVFFEIKFSHLYTLIFEQ